MEYLPENRQKAPGLIGHVTVSADSGQVAREKTEANCRGRSGLAELGKIIIY